MSKKSRRIKLLAKNSVFNLAGQLAPLFAALFAVPLLIKGLGTERFAVLTLAWVFIGYFSLFDLGLGRALTKLVAERISGDGDGEIPELVRCALLLMFLLGIAGSVIAFLIMPWAVGSFLKIPEELRKETLIAFYLLGGSIPLIITGAGLRGILEAYHRFDITNYVRIPLGVYSFAAPLLVLPFSQSLVYVVALLVAGRFGAWVVQFFFCVRISPGIYTCSGIRMKYIRPLLGFGGWMTVSNIIGPFMVYFDRFLIGAMASVAAVAYYTTPYEVVTKVLLIPGALAGVLFPSFSSGFIRDRESTAVLFARGVKYVYLAVFPLVLIIVTFSREGLYLWLGPEFARESYRVLQILSLGVLINSTAQIPFSLIQGAGRPDITAKLHLLELPLYSLLLWFLIGSWGILGAAIAWTLRILLDTILLFIVTNYLFKEGMKLLLPRLVVMALSALLLLPGAFISGAVVKALSLGLVLSAYIFYSWRYFLDEEERGLIKKMAGAFKKLQGDSIE